MNPPTTPPASPALTVYYDGACPVCRKEIALYQGQAGAQACQWVDAATAPEPALGHGLQREAALARLHVRRPNGELVHGAAAFALLWQQLPATRALGRMAALPVVRHLLEGAYRVFLWVRPLWRKPPAAPRG